VLYIHARAARITLAKVGVEVLRTFMPIHLKDVPVNKEQPYTPKMLQVQALITIYSKKILPRCIILQLIFKLDLCKRILERAGLKSQNKLKEEEDLTSSSSVKMS
tara:strand:- start:272 stop:586 length:315 start_codon:yes stop_codon:yes gene_type:complete